MTSISAEQAPSQPKSLPFLAAKFVLDRAMQEYLVSSAYFRGRGAQTSSEQYGGSRSLIYYQMLGHTSTLRGLMSSRAEFRARHQDNVNDELGAVLRIVGFRLRRVPVVGEWLENTIRADDAVMSRANFDYPDGYDRVVGEPAKLQTYLKTKKDEV